jgi:hypothetical protein
MNAAASASAASTSAAVATVASWRARRRMEGMACSGVSRFTSPQCFGNAPQHHTRLKTVGQSSAAAGIEELE